MGTQSPETRREKNKHTKKNFAPSWPYLQDHTRMHGQQNIKENATKKYRNIPAPFINLYQQMHYILTKILYKYQSFI